MPHPDRDSTLQKAALRILRQLGPESPDQVFCSWNSANGPGEAHTGLTPSALPDPLTPSPLTLSPSLHMEFPKAKVMGKVPGLGPYLAPSHSPNLPLPLCSPLFLLTPILRTLPASSVVQQLPLEGRFIKAWAYKESETPGCLGQKDYREVKQQALLRGRESFQPAGKVN